MALDESATPDLVPDLLYHTCLTVIDPGTDKPQVYVLSSHSTIEAAKKSAVEAIPKLGFDKDEFEVYQEQIHATENWEHGGGVVVYAKTPAGQDFLVGTDTKANAESLEVNADGTLALPHGIDHLHYVLQTTIDYKGRPAVFTEIQGAYTKRSDALEAAKKCLLSDDVTVADYAQYDQRDLLKPPEDWPFGEDVLVHAVANTGENFLISLTTPPKAYLRFRRGS